MYGADTPRKEIHSSMHHSSVKPVAVTIWHLMKPVPLFVAAIISSLAVPSAHAIDAGMPNPPSKPTTVKCGLFVLDIVDIDDVNETFEAEIAIVATWDDPRLAFDPVDEGTDKKIFQGEFQFNEIFTGWWPQLVIINQIGRGDTNAIKISVLPNGEVTYLEQRNVRLETPMALYDYPFDIQNLRAFMIPFGNMSEEVVLEVDDRYRETTESYAKRESTVNVAGWDFLNLNMDVDSTQLQLHETAPTFSRMVTTIVLERQSWQIVWVLLFPLVVLVSMAWSTFWLDPESISDRLNISFVGILTIVAYQFVVIDNMPRNSYLTFTDTLLLVSFLITSLTIPHSLYVKSLTEHDKTSTAHQYDKICRWAFPLAYAAAIFVSFTLYKLN